MHVDMYIMYIMDTFVQSSQYDVLFAHATF